MIRPGERLENPVTGEVLIFHRTAAETRGELVLVETIIQPNGFVAAAHVHPAQTERFTILAGTLELRLGAETIQAREGDELVVPPPQGRRTGSGTRVTTRRASSARSGRRSSSSPWSRRCSRWPPRARPAGAASQTRSGSPS